jgi:5-formyltetrahydrofolate cyclo-ligase
MHPDATNPDVPLTGSALHEAKRTLRAERIAIRDALDPDWRAAASREIAERLALLPSFRAAEVLLITLPFRSEWDTRPLLETALSAGKVVAVPRVNHAARMLDLHAIRDVSRDTARGYRGIPEPAATLPRVDFSDIEWVLVPGVAFDLTRRRLGYGGGFYDRLLPLLQASASRIAGAFEVQLVERVPAAPHDLMVDSIVTEKRILTTADQT